MLVGDHDRSCFVGLEDRHGSVEVIVFARLFAAVRDLLVEDAAVLVQGQLQKDEKSVKILANELIPIEKAEETWTASVHFNLEITRTDRQTLIRLRDILRQHPGSSPAFLHLRGSDNTDCLISLAEEFKLKVDARLAREVNDLLGYRAMETRCSAVKAANGTNGNGSRAAKRGALYG